MTIRFAGAIPSNNRVTRAWRCRSVALCAANDNVRSRPEEAAWVVAAHHFAQHGLASAEQAGVLATAARSRGDGEECHRWLAVCGQFDRRLAQRLRRGLFSSSS